jgi:predicted DNA-binding protein
MSEARKTLALSLPLPYADLMDYLQDNTGKTKTQIIKEALDLYFKHLPETI